MTSSIFKQKVKTINFNTPKIYYIKCLENNKISVREAKEGVRRKRVNFENKKGNWTNQTILIDFHTPHMIRKFNRILFFSLLSSSPPQRLKLICYIMRIGMRLIEYKYQSIKGYSPYRHAQKKQRKWENI